MKVRTLRDAARFVDSVGFAYVFPDNRTPLPSLWGAVQGNPMKPMSGDDWDWTPAVARAWDLKNELGEKRKAWFGRYFRGKGSLISLEMLAPLYRLVGGATDGLLPEGRQLVERLRNVGPMSTYHLRMSLRLSGRKGNARFDKVTVQLYRRLLIANVGTDDRETRWPAAVIGLLSKWDPEIGRKSSKLTPVQAAESVMAKAPKLKPASFRALFGFPPALGVSLRFVRA